MGSVYVHECDGCARRVESPYYGAPIGWLHCITWAPDPTGKFPDGMQQIKIHVCSAQCITEAVERMGVTSVNLNRPKNPAVGEALRPKTGFRSQAGVTVRDDSPGQPDRAPRSKKASGRTVKVQHPGGRPASTP